MKNSSIGIILLLGFYIYLLIGMDTGLLILIIIGIAGIAVAVVDILFRVIIEPRLKKNRDDKKKHKKDLIDRILRNLQLLIIEYDNYRIWMDDLDKIKKQDEYNLTMQHLKAYPDILNSLDNTNEQIDGENGLNIKLGKIKDYVQGEINSKLGEEYVGLLSSVWKIIEGTFQIEDIENSDDMNKFLDGINIEIKNKMIYVDSEDSNNLITISGRKMSVPKVKKFLSDLIADTEFRKNLTEIKIKNDNLEKTFNHGFKKNLDEFLKDIEGREEDFKGECGECSFWVRLLGDC